ncbi:uncharacterized protein STEHIDRAFT_67254, partial [Stereum hirsutum FP-91666 SS1]|uniref:uncharacterized protein n=1 Tax=Stereum hirsutum (strain FP-91666) TaxID=721885 RepID=UPI0004449510
WPAANKIRRDHPISKIDIFTGWIVDGITVTYDLADGTQKAVQHGSKTVTATVTLNAHYLLFADTEVIADVSGMAGYHNYYKKALVCTISFNILDTKTGIMRVAGPYGNSDKANAGQPYHFSGPFVFAGFADNAAEHGMSPNFLRHSREYS